MKKYKKKKGNEKPSDQKRMRRDTKEERERRI